MRKTLTAEMKTRHRTFDPSNEGQISYTGTEV